MLRRLLARELRLNDVHQSILIKFAEPLCVALRLLLCDKRRLFFPCASLNLTCTKNPTLMLST